MMFRIESLSICLLQFRYICVQLLWDWKAIEKNDWQQLIEEMFLFFREWIHQYLYVCMYVYVHVYIYRFDFNNKEVLNWDQFEKGNIYVKFMWYVRKMKLELVQHEIRISIGTWNAMHECLFPNQCRLFYLLLYSGPVVAALFDFKFSLFFFFLPLHFTDTSPPNK